VLWRGQEFVKSGRKNQKALNQESRRIAFPETLLTKPIGIRKSKTSSWRAAALILLNLLMVAHVIQWWIMGRTVSPIEPSETMHTLQRGAVNAGFIFFFLGDSGHIDLRPFCLLLGLSHSRPPGFLRLDA